MEENNNRMELEQSKEKKKYKTFKEYYADEEFRKKHLERMKQTTQCKCGKSITRSNMSAHVKTAMHARRMKKLEEEQNNEGNKKLLEILLKEIHDLKAEKNKIKKH